MKTIFTPLLGLSLLFFTVSACSQNNVHALKYQDGNTKLEGYFLAPANHAKKAPGIVVIHAWMGISAHEKNTVERLSKLGYNALAADIYGEGVKPKNTKEAGKLAGYYETNYQIYHTRIKAAINEIIKQGADPNKIVVIGYCFGGTGAIEAARANMPVKGIVSFHGGLYKDSLRENNPHIVPKLLILHGADDPFQTQEAIRRFQKEMRDGKADWQMVYFGNAVHAFTDPAAGNDNSKGAAYNKKADERSWQYMLIFLKEVFEK
ncbi:dienelactone hydrolase family protein [Arachidicoccus sp.]|jgi:dienelactone hydrolase|uniref:dienelactone hydrolase family protein n=1 Tax=Arachidicoccus sp. TaxID=1872624 RepID=UPI003D1FBDCD